MKPITFKTEMIRAILDGRKSQTRRIIKPQPEISLYPCGTGKKYWAYNPLGIGEYFHHNYGMVGDVLYVKETYAINPWSYLGGCKYLFKADYDKIPKCDLGTSYPDVTKWKSSRFMPKAAARIFLKITDIRVERLNDISEEDAIAEGVPNANSFMGIGVDESMANRYAYRELWESINGEGSWSLNPYVWVISFNSLPQQKCI